MIELPESPAAFADATLEQVQPLYEDLSRRRLEGDEAVERWLADWSRLDSLLGEAATKASIAYTTDTADAEKERRHLAFRNLMPQVQPLRVQLQRKLVESGYSRPDLATTVRRMANEIDLFRDESVPLVQEEGRLAAAYQKRTASMTVEWEGEAKTIPQLKPFLYSSDRSVREKAFRLSTGQYVEARDELADIYDRQFELRSKIAANAGFESFRDYAHRQKNRFDYSVDDCMSFHTAVEAAVAPALRRARDRRRAEMGLDSLRPWDLTPDPEGKPPLTGYRDQKDMIDKAQRVFDAIDPAVAGYWDVMNESDMLDLVSRAGKAPGGYCTSLPFSKLPFIFVNGAGIAEDVRVVLHEAGHAFHSLRADELPLIWQRFPGSEMAEVASMSMELLSLPYMDSFFSEEESKRWLRDQMEHILRLLCHICAVDAQQHWTFTHPAGADREAREANWLHLRERFDPGVDWSGLRNERVSQYYSQLHFFQVPFYYIEYGIAQLGALQVWRNALKDQPGAVEAYLRALALGGTAPLPELFAAAGARLMFDAEGMQELVDLMEQQIAASL